MKKFLMIIAAIACIVFVGCTDGNKRTPTTENLTQAPTVEQPEQADKQEINIMYITVNENKLKVTLAENSSVDALSQY